MTFAFQAFGTPRRSRGDHHKILTQFCDKELSVAMTFDSFLEYKAWMIELLLKYNIYIEEMSRVIIHHQWLALGGRFWFEWQDLEYVPTYHEV